jgi:hypothetical protein
MRSKKRIMTVPLLGAIAAISLSASMATASSGGNDGVQRSGSCSGASHWKLNAKPRDGRTATEFEVDQNRSGVTWHFKIRLNGSVVAKGARVTNSRSGSFTVERRIANPAGKDRISAVATRNGETCHGSLTI